LNDGRVFSQVIFMYRSFGEAKGGAGEL